MGNLGTVLAKLTALAGGAVLGAWLANWFERQMSQAQKQAEEDRLRYSQGLGPVETPPASDHKL